jgi:hypothetical protein
MKPLENLIRTFKGIQNFLLMASALSSRSPDTMANCSAVLAGEILPGGENIAMMATSCSLFGTAHIS